MCIYIYIYIYIYKHSIDSSPKNIFRKNISTKNISSKNTIKCILSYIMYLSSNSINFTTLLINNIYALMFHTYVSKIIGHAKKKNKTKVLEEQINAKVACIRPAQSLSA